LAASEQGNEEYSSPNLEVISKQREDLVFDTYMDWVLNVPWETVSYTTRPILSHDLRSSASSY